MTSKATDRIEIPLDVPSLPNGWEYAALATLVDPDRGIRYGIVQPGKPVPNGVQVIRVPAYHQHHE